MHPVSKTSTTDLPFPLTFLTHISDNATLGRGHPDPAVTPERQRQLLLSEELINGDKQL